VCTAAYDRGLLMETSGPEDEVVKLMPPLTTTAEELSEGLDILQDSVDTVLV
jgi:diaminobutyrate-2-oxoglutarate transaminase